MTRHLVLVLVIVLVLGCSSRPPCDEPTPGPLGDIALVDSRREPANVKLVHYVSFEMGPIQETLTGYMIVRAPDALRLYGMSETGQRAFDVAVVRGKVNRIYRAPFLKDDRILDQIAGAAEKIFLGRPMYGRAFGIDRRDEGYVVHEGGGAVEWFWAGPNVDLRWLRGDKFSACFMDWTTDNGVYAPRRIHFHSEEGRYPYDLRMKLVDAKLLPASPPDSLFEAPK